MSERYTDDDIIYSEIRRLSPQWEVSVEGRKLAIVTERWIKEPPYELVVLNADGTEGASEEYEDRDAVSERVLELANGKVCDEQVQ